MHAVSRAPLNMALELREINMRPYNPIAGAVICAILATACATPIQYGDAEMITYDRDTQYSVASRPDGFTISIYYSRYQFIPESHIVAVACRGALTEIALGHAEKHGHKIAPLNEQRIRILISRAGFTGVTSCSATAVAEWQA